MMKTAELEDARQEYMEYMDMTIHETTSLNDPIETNVLQILLNIRNQYRGPIYRNINSTEQTRRNIGKIQRLSRSGAGWSSGSVTNEANSELAEKTASQIMLDRAITPDVAGVLIKLLPELQQIIETVESSGVADAMPEDQMMDDDMPKDMGALGNM